MLRFRVYAGNGRLADNIDLSSAYLVGGDGVAVRAEIEFKNGEILCRKRLAGPVGLAMLWPVEGLDASCWRPPACRSGKNPMCFKWNWPQPADAPVAQARGLGTG